METNEEKAKELYYYHCNEKSCGGFNDCKNCPKSKVDESLLKMAAWKDSEFEKRVTLALCIDCCEYESCEKCHKYNLKKELLGL